MFNRDYPLLWKLSFYKNQTARLKPQMPFSRVKNERNLIVFINGWIYGKFWDLKPENELQCGIVFPSRLQSIGQLLSVHVHRYRGASGAIVFTIRFFLAQGFHFVWILQDRVVVPLPRQLHRGRREAVEYFLVVRLLSLSGSFSSILFAGYISHHTVVSTHSARKRFS